MYCIIYIIHRVLVGRLVGETLTILVVLRPVRDGKTKIHGLFTKIEFAVINELNVWERDYHFFFFF